MPYHRGLYAAELMEGLALVKERKREALGGGFVVGLDELSASRPEPQRRLPTNPPPPTQPEQLGNDQLSRAYS